MESPSALSLPRARLSGAPAVSRYPFVSVTNATFSPNRLGSVIIRSPSRPEAGIMKQG